MKSVALNVSIAFTLVLSTSLMLQVRAAEPANATAGLAFLTHGLYGNPSGVTDLVFENLWRVWDGDDAQKAKNATHEEIRKIAFARYGMIEAPYDNDGVPLGYNKGEDGVWYSNCLLCHSGTVNGKAKIGAPNNRLDLTTFNEDIVLLLRLSKGQSIHRPVQLPMQMSTSRGVTNAVIFSHELLAMRDSNLDLMEDLVDLGPRIDHDLDASPWWNVQFKERLYIDAFVPKGARALMQFAMNPHNDGGSLREMLPNFENVLSYIESIEIPKYTGKVDETLAATGKKVFEASCATCHGTYGETPSYPKRLVPISLIKTDPVRLEALTVEFRKYYHDGWLGDFGKSDVWLSGKGYVAPPLHGIFASAPYFHNGSVPTLYHVLNPKKRPRVWRVRDYDAFDHIKVGLAVDTFDKMPSQAITPAESRRYYDTTQFGKFNQGHNYPNVLSENEKAAVLEYLKTL